MRLNAIMAELTWPPKYVFSTQPILTPQIFAHVTRLAQGQASFSHVQFGMEQNGLSISPAPITPEFREAVNALLKAAEMAFNVGQQNEKDAADRKAAEKESA